MSFASGSSPLGSAGPTRSFIVTRTGGYMLDPDEVWLDADQFEAEISAGLTLFAQGDAAARGRTASSEA